MNLGLVNYLAANVPLEDVIQETFVRAFRALKGLQQAAAFERWLLAIARNRALTLDARKEAARRSVEQLSVEIPHQAPALPPALALERAVCGKLPQPDHMSPGAPQNSSPR